MIFISEGTQAKGVNIGQNKKLYDFTFNFKISWRNIFLSIKGSPLKRSEATAARPRAGQQQLQQGLRPQGLLGHYGPIGPCMSFWPLVGRLRPVRAVRTVRSYSRYVLGLGPTGPIGPCIASTLFSFFISKRSYHRTDRSVYSHYFSVRLLWGLGPQDRQVRV